MKQTEILTHVTHVNDWEPAVYVSSMSQNFRLFHVSRHLQDKVMEMALVSLRLGAGLVLRKSF